MGLLSTLGKAIGKVASGLQNISGKLINADVLKERHRIKGRREEWSDKVLKGQGKHDISKIMPPQLTVPAPPKPEVQYITPDVARMQRKLELAVQAAITGKVGNANASKDADKLDKQLEYALNVEAAKDKAAETGEEEPPVVVYDSPDEELLDVELTEDQQARLNSGLNPWVSLGQ